MFVCCGEVGQAAGVTEIPQVEHDEDGIKTVRAFAEEENALTIPVGTKAKGEFPPNSDFDFDPSYKGQLSDGLRHGKGHYIYRDKGEYEGQWIQGKAQGKGKYTNGSKKSTYEGQWDSGITVIKNMV